MAALPASIPPVIQTLQDLWHSFLDAISGIVIPDWGVLVNLLPVFLFFGVIMPILTLLVLAWFLYVVRRPRPKLNFVEGPRLAPLDSGGERVYPRGEPYCLRDGLIYDWGTTRCERDGVELTVLCPKCGVARSAAISTCGNCGLEIRLEPRVRALRPAGPPPGGAAVA
jgi:hypothetical protein